jgi:GT2 family glycosyltransferase
MYEVSVIILNYNSSEFTIDCINSILTKTQIEVRYEIIVVDNASGANDYYNLSEQISKLNDNRICLIRNNINTGFGAGNMIGVQKASGKYLAFINNDTLLQNDCLSILFKFLDTNKKVAICSPQQYDDDLNVKKSFDHFLTLRRELFGRKILEFLFPNTYPKRQKIYSDPLKVQCVPGSFLFTRASDFNAIGGFDTNLFLYYEETDLCFRLKNKFSNSNSGLCYLVPMAKYIHFKGKSTKMNIDIKKELKISLFYVLKKNSSYIAYQILRWWLTFKYLIKSIYNPKNFKFFNLCLIGAPLTKSLRHKQFIKQL